MLKKKILLSHLAVYLKSNKGFFNALSLGTLSSFLSQGFNFVTIILITRALGETAMGHFAMTQSIVIMLITFGILGQNISSSALTGKFRRRYPNHLGQLIGNSYLLTTLMTLLVILAYVCLSGKLFPIALITQEGSFFLKVVILIWFTGMTFDMLQASTLIGLESFRYLVKTDLLKGLFSILVILPLALFLGLTGAFAGYAVSSLIGVLLNQWFIRKELAKHNARIEFSFNPVLVLRILKIGLPVFVAALFISPTIWLTNRLVFDAENGPSVLGIIFVCRQLLVLLQFVPVQISRVALPLITNSKGAPEEHTIKRLSLLTSLLACILLASAGILLEDNILAAYGLDPEVSLMPYRITIVTLFFSATNMIIGQFAIAGRSPWNRAYADMIIALVTVAVTLAMVKTNLILALPVAMLISLIISNVFLIFSTKSEIPSFIR